MKVWWINCYSRVIKGGCEQPDYDIRISLCNEKYRVWKACGFIYDYYTLLFTIDNLEAAIMYGLDYLEEKYK